MNLTDELRKLADLHREGQLTDLEFAAGKSRLLVQTGGEAPLRPVEAADATGAAGPIKEKTYKSSHWSAGNLFFPDRLTLAGDGMLFRKGAMFGSSEEHINYRAVASFKVKHGIFLSTVCIETTGGSQPIFVNGLWKSDAKEIQAVVSACQRSG